MDKDYIEKMFGSLLDVDGLMIPPFAKYPDIKHRSIGWRMGAGETYASLFWDWWQKQDSPIRTTVTKKYPEPTDWPDYWRIMLAQPICL